MGSAELRREGDLDLDLGLDLRSTLSSIAAFCMNGSMLSRSSGIEIEWKEA